MLALYRDNGREIGNYHSRLGLYRTMEKKKETTVVDKGYIGIVGLRFFQEGAIVNILDVRKGDLNFWKTRVVRNRDLRRTWVCPDGIPCRILIRETW